MGAIFFYSITIVDDTTFNLFKQFLYFYSVTSRMLNAITFFLLLVSSSSNRIDHSPFLVPLFFTAGVKFNSPTFLISPYKLQQHLPLIR